jgi:hypothetical protein
VQAEEREVQVRQQDDGNPKILKAACEMEKRKRALKQQVIESEDCLSPGKENTYCPQGHS